MLHGYIDIPTIYFFKEKNIWTGSVFDEFNYRIMPSESNDGKKELYSVIWYGKLCFDLIDSKDFIAEFHLPLTAEGLTKLTEEINKAVEKYKKDVEYAWYT